MDNTLREAIQVAAQYTTAMSAEDAGIVEAANRAALSQPPAPEQASGEQEQCCYGGPREACGIPCFKHKKAATPTAEPAVEAVTLLRETFQAIGYRDSGDLLELVKRACYRIAEDRDLIAMQMSLMDRYKAKAASPAAPVAAFIASQESLPASMEKVLADNLDSLYSRTAAPEAAKPEQQAQGEPLITVESSLRFNLECEKQKSADYLDQVRDLKGAISKKDAALKACVESWDKYWQSGRTEADAIEFVLAINNARKELK